MEPWQSGTLKRVTLYSKSGCHLCDDVRALLQELAPEYGFHLEETDIEDNDAVFERYRYAIPVVTVDGREVARGKIDERELLLALAMLRS
jgi:glutaredoxin